MSAPHLFAILILVLPYSSCRKAPPPPPRATTSELHLYRFDDELQKAVVDAPAVSSSSAVAAPVVWHNFFSEGDITWIPLRGRMGYRQGDLILKGDGNTPVILAPKEPPISWDLYQAVQIRMLAEGGREIKIKIGDDEFRQKLGPLRQYNTYYFDIHIESGSSVRPFLIMPTDGVNDLVAIRSIELIPRKTDFPEAAGRRFIGKREEYRNAIFAHSPSTLSYEVQVPAAARLHFGAGIAANNSPVAFRIVTGGRELYAKTVTDAGAWEDAEIDLSPYSGLKIKLEFQTAAATSGAVGFWANPLVTSAAPRSRPNVLLYMIDTLRADHASLYSYARDTTPFLKKLGAAGVVFDDCQVQATWTKPSVASMMTSLYSFAHGIRRDDDTIPKRSVTLAEQLRAAGYVTASMVANPLVGRLSALDRGFDYLSEWQAVARRIEKDDRATDSAALNRLLFPWLEHHATEPFFLYAHATDPHAPYQVPAAFESRFAPPAETPGFDRDFEKLTKMALQRGGFGINRDLCLKAGIDPDRFIRRVTERYDAKILHNDTSLEQLVEKLRQLGILDNTLIVVVSDHGEEFWDHRWTGHGQSVYQELAHGVLLMWNPKLIPAPRRVDEPVQSIDVMPTLLDLLGIRIPEVAEGQSLLPLLKGQPFQRRGFVVSSRYAHPYSQRNESLPENHIDSMALMDADWKLVYREKGKEVGLNRAELYDRRRDSQDSNNIAAQHPQQVDRMTTDIGKWMQAQKQMQGLLGPAAKAGMDQQTLGRLRTLGYLGGKQ